MQVVCAVQAARAGGHGLYSAQETETHLPPLVKELHAKFSDIQGLLSLIFRFSQCQGHTVLRPRTFLTVKLENSCFLDKKKGMFVRFLPILCALLVSQTIPFN